MTTGEQPQLESPLDKLQVGPRRSREEVLAAMQRNAIKRTAENEHEARPGINEDLHTIWYAQPEQDYDPTERSHAARVISLEERREFVKRQENLGRIRSTLGALSTDQLGVVLEIAKALQQEGQK